MAQSQLLSTPPLFTLGALSLSLACAADLRLPTGEDTLGATVATQALGTSEYITRIDASDRDQWVLFSFSTGAEVSGSPPEADAGVAIGDRFLAPALDWDLAFQRFHIRSNGGVSGSGDTAIAALSEQDFESLTVAPKLGFLQDVADSDDDDSFVDTPFEMEPGWYAYDSSDNSLSPNDITYVVRTTDGSHYKLQFLDYYDSARSSGHPQFAWALIVSP